MRSTDWKSALSVTESESEFFAPVKNDVKSHLINRGEWPYDPLYQRNRDCPTCVKYSLFLPNVILTNSSAVVIVAREPHG